MRARVLAVGEKMPAWVETGCTEYTKRLSKKLPLEWVEVPPGRRGKSLDPGRAIAEEGAAMLAALPRNIHVIALDGRGVAWTSEQLADQLQRWRMLGRDIAFLIGGPDGLATTVLERSQQKWSLGPLTLPHPVVRVVLAEQLYRAVSLLAHHPYHRG